MTIRRLFNIFMASTCLLALSSCQDDEEQVSRQVRENFINLSITVENASAAKTRVPTGGENGDGREAGIERENKIEGITLVLYMDDDGINSTKNPTLDFVRFFNVKERTVGANPTIDPYTEVTYETGDQPIGRPNLDFTKSYHAIVIANQTLPTSIKEGVSTLNDLLALSTDRVYNGDPTKKASECNLFVMSSEKDGVLNFGGVTPTKDDAGDLHYDMTAQPLQIERMAARIDFWTKNATYDGSKSTYKQRGYVYNVKGSTKDKFVLTGIVPFNLTNGDATYGQEYFIKQICATATDLETPTVLYLADEDKTNYVYGFKTKDKTVEATLSSPLSGLYTLIGNGTIETATSYYKSMETLNAEKTTLDGSDNLIVAYPMENTLRTDSKLYYHATGVAIIGYYYLDGIGDGTRYVYLGYLRHQGDKDTYDVLPYTSPLSKTDEMGSSIPMNYGVVRNNIYRLSINSVDKKGTLELSIKVKEWDPFIHDFIYM